MNNQIRLSILATCVLLCSTGCGFIGAGTIGEAVYTSRDQERTLYYKMLKRDNSEKQRSSWHEEIFKGSDIEAEWGIADEVKKVSESVQEWTYKWGLRWKGVNIFLLVPIRIPLAVPMGHKTITFILVNNELRQWRIRDDHWCISYLGFNFLPLDPEGKSFGFFAETSCGGSEDMSVYDGKMACDIPFYDKCFPASSPAYGRGENLM